MHHECRVDLDAGVHERVDIACAPLARGGYVLVLDDHPDPAVAECDQVLDEAPRTGGAVAEHDIAFDPRDRPVDQDERHPEPREPLQLTS